MMKRLGIIAAIISVIVTFCPIYALEVRTMESKELVYQQLAKKNDYFDIQWIHSVTKRPVVETYQLIDENRIAMERMIFDENGPNLPVGPYGNQKFVLREDGWFEVSNYDLEFSQVPVTIGKVISNHTLVYRGVSTFLKEVDRPGGHVDIGFVQNRVYQYIIKEVCLWTEKEKK